MFAINTGQAIEECGNLESQVSDLFEQIMELEQVVRNLNTLSGMEEPIAKLRNQLGCMIEEHCILRQMMQGLNKISLYYMKCENRICDNGEQSTIRYTRREIGVNDFSSIANLLEKISLG